MGELRACGAIYGGDTPTVPSEKTRIWTTPDRTVTAFVPVQDVGTVRTDSLASTWIAASLKVRRREIATGSGASGDGEKVNFKRGATDTVELVFKLERARETLAGRR